MQLVIVHNHFRPGGVRRVIELATPHLVTHWPEKLRAVVLATGEAPDAAWLSNFRHLLRGTPVQVLVEPAFGYVSEQVADGKALRHRIVNGLTELVGRTSADGCVIWAHNLGLGRNLPLARELTFACHDGHIPLIAHHHDWWFENRWHHFAAMRERGFRTLPAVASAVLTGSSTICHVAINQADATVLEKHFPGLAGWLPNPAESGEPPLARRVQFARDWLRDQLGNDAPVWLLPSRLLRRKNIAEAALLTRWLRPEAWLVTTGGVSSAEEQAYADQMAAAASQHGWRLRLGVLQNGENEKPTVPELMAASEAIVFTSIQEGFGLPYLEAAAARRPLIARSLPNIAPDLAKFGFQFPHCYGEVLVPPDLFDWASERERQVRLFREWKALMPRAAAKLVGTPALLADTTEPRAVPFSRLTLTAQLEVLAQPVEASWTSCAALNPVLRSWRKKAKAMELEPTPWPRSAERWLGGRSYARHFLELVPPLLARAPRVGASQAAQQEFLRKKLGAENLYPLLWTCNP
ncbi:MAG: glycosyltransferase [Verrucomicrobia bacterium]|nr:glycosyltransferase [Verrucomicrobiota bacterium]